MSEFIVDRPGRYRTREAGIVDIKTIKYRGPEPYFAFDKPRGEGGRKWGVDGMSMDSYGTVPYKADRSLDLIAYLGPLEEEMICSTVNDPTSFATDIGIVPADPAISDAAWKLIETHCRPFSRDVENAYYADNGLVLRTREEWDEAMRDLLQRQAGKVMLSADLAAARAEIDRLKLEIAALEKSRNHCEFCDSVIAVKAIAPAHPRIPLTTPQIDRYTMPMLGTQR